MSEAIRHDILTLSVVLHNMNIGKTCCGKTIIESIMIIEENLVPNHILNAAQSLIHQPLAASNNLNAVLLHCV